MSREHPMPPELERKLYYDGIALFNAGDYFDAHEVWEDAWHMAYGIKHEFYQGLIQCAVALEHYRRANPRGVVSLSKSYPPKFKNVPPLFMGLDVLHFLNDMREVLRPIVDAPQLPAPDSMRLEVASVPKIELKYDPFETGEAARFNKPEKW
jgi:hypothetical protein